MAGVRSLESKELGRATAGAESEMGWGSSRSKNVFLLDSGAFSAWNNGKVIDLDHYIAFILHEADHLDYYVALDVIPGSFGHTPSPAEVEESATRSWENLLYMEAHGLQPIPVFHMGEQFKWLRRMVEHGCPYIGISPANDRTTSKKRVWLDRVFSEITDDAGKPLVKTHAFGVTAIDLLMRYPWYSADSTTWIMMAARGKIMLPAWVDGKWKFDKRPAVLYLSEPYGEGDALVRGLKDSAWRHIPSQRQHVEEWLKYAGSNLELAEGDYRERTRLCAFFFLEFERHFVPQPFKKVATHLFKDT